MKQLNLAEFTALPHNPAYMVHPDGRVVSLKKESPRVLSEQKGRSPVWWRVRIGRIDVRIRDLVLVMFGTSAEFEERAWEWISETALFGEEVA